MKRPIGVNRHMPGTVPVPKQTVPHIHKVLLAIFELEKHPAVKAYLLLKASVGEPNG